MRPLKSLISIDQAQKIINDNIREILETEIISLSKLEGRVAARSVVATTNIPPFRRAAMDGYAIKASSSFNATDSSPVFLKCIEEIHAGEVPSKEIHENECVEIATGAMVPDSADAVIQVELTNRINDSVELFKAIAPGTNLSKEGADVKAQEIVITKGDVYTPARIGVLAALNKESEMVFKKPRVAVIPTGREITALGTELKRGQVYDINSHTLAALVAKNGGIPIIYEIVADEFDDLERAILDALPKSDLIVIGGGSSVGERDINIDVINKHGKVLFHGIQIKPGKPTLFGTINRKPVLNLPGYPTSCLTNGYIIMLPILRTMSHLPQIILQKVKAKLSKKMAFRLGRHQIYTVKLEGEYAVPAFKESGAITSMAWADGYIEIPYNVDLIDKDEEVEVILF